jgi:hypothetical protein
MFHFLGQPLQCSLADIDDAAAGTVLLLSVAIWQPYRRCIISCKSRSIPESESDAIHLHFTYIHADALAFFLCRSELRLARHQGPRYRTAPFFQFRIRPREAFASHRT